MELLEQSMLSSQSLTCDDWPELETVGNGPTPSGGLNEWKYDGRIDSPSEKDIIQIGDDNKKQRKNLCVIW